MDEMELSKYYQQNCAFGHRAGDFLGEPLDKKVVRIFV